jgi:hypothetical protein
VATTIPNKVQLTVSVDRETRKLFEKYGGQRGIGRLMKELIRKHDMEEHYSAEMVRTRLDRIESHLLHVLEEREEGNSAS